MLLIEAFFTTLPTTGALARVNTVVSRQEVNRQIRESLGLTPKHMTAPTLPVEGHLCDFPIWSYSKKRASVTTLHVDYGVLPVAQLDISAGIRYTKPPNQT